MAYSKSVLKLVPQYKLWIKKDGHVVFGDGRLELLQAIDEYGSINQAAAKLNMSYRAAWGKIKTTEQRLGFKVIDKHIGGTNSGSELTPNAKKLVSSYIQFSEDTSRTIDQLFNQYFGDFIILDDKD